MIQNIQINSKLTQVDGFQNYEEFYRKDAEFSQSNAEKQSNRERNSASSPRFGGKKL